MLFSILIANYNNGHFFEDCYKSIISQTYKNWEVILVDDASTDNSLEVIKNIIGNDQRFKIYENYENKGCGYTKNRCCKLATGEILGFLDPDDTLKFVGLEIMVDSHLKHLDASIISSKYELVDMQLNFINFGCHGSAIPPNKSYLTYGKGAITSFAAFKRDKYFETIGIDSFMKRAVDQDLYYKLEEKGEHVFVNKVLYSYRIHTNSISNNENLFKAEYWHFFAVNKAYLRRKLMSDKIDNFSNEYMRKYRMNYYLSRFEKLKFSNRKKSQFYFLFKYMFSNPFHRVEFKFKSLILLLLGRI